jgi:hypothetical protein
MEFRSRRVSIRRLTARLRGLANIRLNRLAPTHPMAVLRIASRIRRNILSSNILSNSSNTRSNLMLLKRVVMLWLFRVDPFSGFESIKG